MKSKCLKRLITGGLVFSMIGGIAPFEPINNALDLAVTAQAETGSVTFDEYSYTLILSGNVLMLKHISGIEQLDEEQFARADVNGDGEKDMRDVTAILKFSDLTE